MMASNMSESDESGNDVDDDEEVIVPRPYYYTNWDCPHINKFTLEGNGVVKNGWRCDWCMNPPAMFLSFSATKELARVLRLPGSDVRPCSGIIPVQVIKVLSQIPLKTSRRGRQVQCWWQALAFAWRLQVQVNTVCWCKFSITLSPPLLFCKTIVLI